MSSFVLTISETNTGLIWLAVAIGPPLANVTPDTLNSLRATSSWPHSSWSERIWEALIDRRAGLDLDASITRVRSPPEKPMC